MEVIGRVVTSAELGGGEGGGSGSSGRGGGGDGVGSSGWGSMKGFSERVIESG
jgi:hypothetical protein